jgi:hypothetical protein
MARELTSLLEVPPYPEAGDKSGCWFVVRTGALQVGDGLGEITFSMVAGAVLKLAGRQFLRKCNGAGQQTRGSLCARLRTTH